MPEDCEVCVRVWNATMGATWSVLRPVREQRLSTRVGVPTTWHPAPSVILNSAFAILAVNQYCYLENRNGSW